MKNKRLVIIIGLIFLMLLIPFTAMQFSNEVNWSHFDFIIAAFLLFSIGLGLEVILQKVRTRKLRIIFSVVLLTLFFLVWGELAVGLLGSPLAGS
ncbi:hypothetical protein [Owenweeksia hongkongensis]|uniref:hypothetical protein n=1 Tax=Owenweeksia hongkongensis TaxID=253245 RepID=UPI003A9138E0